MSKYMLSDFNALNQINPFVKEGPGGWRKPYGFAHPDSDKESESEWDRSQEKPACQWGITANTNGNFLTEECLPPKNPVTCLMSRPAEPTQEFLPDLYTLIPFPKQIPESLRKLKQEVKKEDFLKFIGPVLILSIVLLLIVRR